MSIIKKIDSGWSKWEHGLTFFGGAAIAVAAFLTTLDVVMRNFFNKPILGSMELVALLLMPIFVCALPGIQAKGNHVIIEFATEKAPAFIKKICTIFGMLVGLFLFSSIAKKLVDTAIAAFVRKDETMGIVHYPLWPVRAILAIAVITMVIRLVLDIILTVSSPTSAFEKREDSGKPDTIQTTEGEADV